MWQFVLRYFLFIFAFIFFVNLQFQFFNAFLALFYIAFYIRDMDRLKTVSTWYITLHNVTFLKCIVYYAYTKLVAELVEKISLSAL